MSASTAFLVAMFLSALHGNALLVVRFPRNFCCFCRWEWNLLQAVANAGNDFDCIALVRWHCNPPTFVPFLGNVIRKQNEFERKEDTPTLNHKGGKNLNVQNQSNDNVNIHQNVNLNYLLSGDVDPGAVTIGNVCISNFYSIKTFRWKITFHVQEHLHFHLFGGEKVGKMVG